MGINAQIRVHTSLTPASRGLIASDCGMAEAGLTMHFKPRTRLIRTPVREAGPER